MYNFAVYLISDLPHFSPPFAILSSPLFFCNHLLYSSTPNTSQVSPPPTHPLHTHTHTSLSIIHPLLGHAVAMLQEMFYQIDCNGEGSVTWDDFTTFLTLTGKHCHYVRAYPRNTYFYLLLNHLERFLLFISMNQAILHFIQYDYI